jgi:hypothetical protein
LVDDTIVDVEDHGGQILADDRMASEVADMLARRVYAMRPELRNTGFSIIVEDEAGDEMHRAP